jgi:leucyl aminopeptidase (aminopeptidase T)
MAREDLHFRLRIPEGLKKEVEAAAAENRRSMTAEIISRLEQSFLNDGKLAQMVDAIAEQSAKLHEAYNTITYLEDVRKALEDQLEAADEREANRSTSVMDDPIFEIVLDANGRPISWPEIAAHIHRTAKAAGVETAGFRAAIFNAEKADDDARFGEYGRLVRWYQDQTRKHKDKILRDDR